MCPQINPDFSEALDSLPPGEYKVRVTDSELKTSQAGNEYLNWKLSTFGSDDSRMNDRVIYHSTPISGKGAGILKQFLKAVGVDPTGGNFDTDMVHGKELAVVVIEDPQGGTFPRVKTVKAIVQAAA